MKRSWKTGAAVVGSMLLAGSILLPSNLSYAQTPTYNTNPSIEDIGPNLRAETLDQALAAGKIDLTSSDQASTNTLASSNQTSLTQADVGTVKQWLTHDDYAGKYRLTNFTLRAVGKYGEVWVANNLNYPTGDPRNSMVAISDNQVRYLLNQFDTNMYEKEVAFFGAPQKRVGENGYKGLYKDDSGRTVILVDNIKDQSYYNSNYPSYIAGYFSPTISDFVDRNVMTIDCYDWLNRMGPNAARPYQYEGTFAHEFQHLLHRDTDPDEETFVNEGLSDFAQYLVGYGHSTSHVDFFMNHLRNSLTLWSDQSDLQILGDYGNAYLFQLYMYEHYGEAFIQEEFKNQNNGIAGINDALKKIGANTDFTKVYGDYMTALMLDGKYHGDNSTYTFNSINLNPNVTAATKLDSNTPAWGTNFRQITPDKKIDHLYFKGIDFLGTNWKAQQDGSKGTVLWGNNGDQVDNHLIKELDLTNLSSASLSFDTKYDIEEQWDFGMVQVSADGGHTWKSLSNGDTRSDVVDEGYPTIKQNVPGFTGSSNGWKTESFDLSQYAGQKVLVDFRYMTDWGTSLGGWYLSNLKLNGTVFDPMTSTSSFQSLEQVLKEYVNYQVEFIGYQKGNANGTDNHVKVIRFNDLLNMSEADRLDLGNMLHSAEYEKVLMMVTYAAPEGKNGSVPFDYQVVMKDTTHKN